MDDYSEEVLYQDYMNKIGEVREQIEINNRNKQMLMEETERFQYVDNNINEILEELYLVNREDESFTRELHQAFEELQEAKVEMGRNVQEMYDNYEREEIELLAEEESIEEDYRRWMGELNQDEINEDVYEEEVSME